MTNSAQATSAPPADRTGFHRQPSTTEQRVFIALPLAYAALLLGVLPVATVPGIENPHVAAVSAGGVLFADVCTAFLLGSDYHRSARPAVLYLTCAYVYSGLMAALHVLTFPGAIVPGPVIGNLQTVSWLFAAWRGGTALLLLIGVLHAAAPAREEPPAASSRRLAQALTLTLAAVVAIGTFFVNVEIQSVAGNVFTGLSLSLNWATVGLYLVAAGLIWRRSAINDSLYLWLALVLVANAADLALTTASGARYTLGWYIGRASWVISACVLLLLWLTHESSGAIPGRLRAIAAYGSALCILLAALLLHWFLLPWLEYSYPFATAFAAVAIAVWLGGWGPAAACAALGFIAARTYFVDPAAHSDLDLTSHKLGILLYVLTCSAIIGLGQAMRRARDRYRASEQRFRESQEASIQGYCLLRAIRDASGAITDFRIEYVNPRGAAMLGREAAELTGASLSSIVPGMRSSGILDIFARVAREREPVDVEIPHDSNDVSRWFRHLVVPVEDGVAVSLSDITDTRRMAIQLRQRAEELQQADSNKSNFLAMLSHELRNPMAPLRNALTVLAMSPEKHTVASVTPIMERQLSHLVRLVDDLLDVSRIDRGKLELKQQRLALESIVRSAIETARPNIEAKSQELVVRFAADPIYVHGDLVRLTQVVSNLLNNAAKFTPERGEIEIGKRIEGSDAVITVSDTGVGIAPEELSRIFDMFVQLDSAKSVGAGGLGLGLTLARSIARMHGGTLEGHSDGPGKGSRFVLRLPAAPAPFDERRRDAASRPATGSRRVLVVDDNEDAATTLASLLRLEGHDVAVAFNGADALRCAADTVPLVAFIDINMPGMDGIELARRLQDDPRTRHVMLVAVTGMGQRADVERTRQAGFAAHLTKPAAPEDVVRLASRA